MRNLEKMIDKLKGLNNNKVRKFGFACQGAQFLIGGRPSMVPFLQVYVDNYLILVSGVGNKRNELKRKERMNKIREEGGVFILFLTTIAEPKERKKRRR